jgi:hypothetical protein
MSCSSGRERRSDLIHGESGLTGGPATYVVAVNLAAQTTPDRGNAGSMPSRDEASHRSVCGFVRCDDAVRDAAAVADLVPASAGPLPDVRTTATALSWSGSAAATAGQNPASMSGERADLRAEFLAMWRAQVNLIRVSAHGE